MSKKEQSSKKPKDPNKTLKRTMIGLFTMILLMIAIVGYGQYTKYKQEKSIHEYADTLQKKSKEISADVAKAKAFNKHISEFLSGKDSIENTNKPDEYENIFKENDGMIGVLAIPKINLRLPVYHDVTDEVIAKAIGHVRDTAFPMDTPGTKSVLLGHNGMPGADVLFTRLDEVVKGDEFSMQLGNIAYTYSVVETKVMTPDEADEYARTPVQPGSKANVTLITCTPYGINSHRYVVIGEFKSAKILEDTPVIQLDSHFSLGKETVIISSIIVTGSIVLVLLSRKLKVKGE